MFAYHCLLPTFASYGGGDIAIALCNGQGLVNMNGVVTVYMHLSTQSPNEGYAAVWQSVNLL